MSANSRVCIAIQHVAFEDLDGFAAPIREAGYTIEYVNAADGLEPAVAGADLLVVLGGPIGAYEEAKYPFLKKELAMIESHLASGRPLMGICLGAQLIARVCGARVYPSGVREIGFAPLQLTERGRESCLAPFDDGGPVLHWHGDTFDLPEGASLLASTSACENQAYEIGSKVLGFQFHPEATGRRIEHWLVGHAAELAAASIDVPAIRAGALVGQARLSAHGRRVVSHWIGGLDQA